VLLCANRAIAQPLDLRVERGPVAEGTLDYKFSWILWWEVNGDAFMREAIGERDLPMDIPPSRRFRREALELLVPMLEDSDPAIRAAAVISLAQMHYEPLSDQLIGPQGADVESHNDTLIDDSHLDVRCAAWVALGLLDAPRCRAFLAEPVALVPEEQGARVAAIGLLTSLDRSHRAALIALLQDDQTPLEVKRMVVWAISQHAPDPNRIDEDVLNWHASAMNWAVDNVPSNFVLSQAIESEVLVNQRGGVPWLIDMLRYYPVVRRLPGYEAIRALPDEVMHGSSLRRLAMETRIGASLALAQLPTPGDRGEREELREMLVRRARSGNRQGPMSGGRYTTGVLDFNRGIDAVALAMHTDGSEADLDVFYDLLRGFTLIPIDEAMPANPETGIVPEDLILRQSTNEVRSYAALAIGLMMRRGTPGNELAVARPLLYERPGRNESDETNHTPLGTLRAMDIERIKRRFGQRLARAVADDGEPLTYRAACALGLGLSADPRFIPVLTEELAKLRGGDELVLGYGLLALAMLGEADAAVVAKRYLTRTGPVGEIDDVLGRRAALDALSILGQAGGDHASDALIGSWGKDPWVSLQAAESISRSGYFEAVTKMLDAGAGDSSRWRLAATMSLGRALESTYPSKLDALITGSNFTMSYMGEIVAEPEEEEEAPRLVPGFVPIVPRLPDLPNDQAEAEPEVVPRTFPRIDDWPMRRFPAYANPFFVYELRG